MESIKVVINVLLIVCFQTYVKTEGQLVVNVKTQGGELLKERIIANISEDSVTLEFSQNDGSHVTQLVDFKQDLQIFRILVLGEEELGQNPYQVLCFVTRFHRGDFISSDAMSKLRQKNPGTVRTPEEDRGIDEFEMDVSIDVPSASILSPHLSSMCAKATTTTYASDRDLKLWATQRQELDGDWSVISESTHRLPYRGVTHCTNSNHDMTSPCVCKYQVCISWYPCGLKYCKGRDNSGKAVSYRCGIRTCRKCRSFSYYVSQRYLCMAEESKGQTRPYSINSVDVQ